MICIDNAGYQFIDSCNENGLFKNDKIELKFFEFRSDLEGADYDKELIKVGGLIIKKIKLFVLSRCFPQTGLGKLMSTYRQQ